MSVTNNHVVKFGNPVKTIIYDSKEIHVKSTIGMKDVVELVVGVADAVFMQDGSYHPEALDIAKKQGIFRYYTDYELPDDISDMYELFYSTNIFDLVCSQIHEEQWNNIEGSIERMIEHRLRTNTIEIEAKLNTMAESLEGLINKVNALFDGIDTSDLSKLADSLEKANFDEEKFIDSYLKVMNKNKTEE